MFERIIMEQITNHYRKKIWIQSQQTRIIISDEWEKMNETRIKSSWTKDRKNQPTNQPIIDSTSICERRQQRQSFHSIVIYIFIPIIPIFTNISIRSEFIILNYWINNNIQLLYLRWFVVKPLAHLSLRYRLRPR